MPNDLKPVIARLEAAILEAAKLSPTGVYGECVVRIGDLRRVLTEFGKVETPDT